VPAGVPFDFEVDDEEFPPQPKGSKMKPASARIIQEARRRFGQSSRRPPAKTPQLNVVMPEPRKGLTVPAMLPAAVETVSVDDWGLPPACSTPIESNSHPYVSFSLNPAVMARLRGFYSDFPLVHGVVPNVRMKARLMRAAHEKPQAMAICSSPFSLRSIIRCAASTRIFRT